MTQQNINLGTYPNDPSADSLNVAFPKVQLNFTELYAGGASAVNVKNFGAKGDGVTDDSTSIGLATAAAKTLGQRFAFFPSGVYNVPTLTGPAATDTIWMGDGASLLNCPFRKNIVPASAPTPPMPPIGIIAENHLPWSRVSASAKDVVTVIIAGDSMAGLSSGGLGPMASVSAYIMDKLRTDNPNVVFKFLVQSIGGATYNTLNNVQGSPPPWWTYGGATWIAGIASSKPQLVFLVFTSNDATGGFNAPAFLNCMAVFAASPIDVVICTSPSRSYDAVAATPGYLNAEATQEDMMAGFLASYAQTHNIGLLDFARQGALIRDGFDPRSSALYNPATGVPTGTVTLPITLPLTRDWSSLIYEFGVAGANALLVPGDIRFQLSYNSTGGNADATNVLHFGRDIASGFFYYQVDTYTGRILIPKTLTAYPCVYAVNGQVYIEFYKRGSHVFLSFNRDDQIVFQGNVEAYGGTFAPTVSCSNGAQSLYMTIVCLSDVSPSRMWMPQLTNREMWGNEDYNPAPGFGGNSGVHPTTLLGERVYREVLDAQSFALTTGEIAFTFTPLIYFSTNLSAATGTFQGWCRMFGAKVEYQVLLKFTSTPVEAGNFNIKFPATLPAPLTPNSGGSPSGWPAQATYTANLLAVTNSVVSASVPTSPEIDFKIAGPDQTATSMAATNLQNTSFISVSGWYIRA